MLRCYKVVEIFKKPDDAQNPAEQCENLEEIPKEENINEETNTQVTVENPDENILSTLETLGEEERDLLAEKSQLQSMEETLKQKLLDEIEVKRHRIENLKYEIPELKQRCEALAKVLNIPVQK
jgi:predicted RNase H-like nuclease (RuvC/YqgF family)